MDVASFQSTFSDISVEELRARIKIYGGVYSSRPSVASDTTGSLNVSIFNRFGYYDLDTVTDVFQLTESGHARVEGEINWKPLEHITHNGRFFDGNAQVVVDIDYITSLYVSYRDRIQNDFSREEQDELMAKLHELIAQAIETTANGYAEGIGGTFEYNGVAGEKSLIKESIFALLEESLSAKSDVSLADLGITTSDNRSGDLYSMNDILAMCFMQMTGVYMGNFPLDDLPARFINLAMRREAVYNAFPVNDSLRDKFETVVNNQINNMIDKINDNFVEQREFLSAWGASKEMLADLDPIDKEFIWQTFDGFVESMRSGLSAMDALKKTSYFDHFFKITALSPARGAFSPSTVSTGRTWIDSYNGLLEQMERWSQASVEGFIWIKKNNWVA